jgi:tetratricopeptide (TPR) repeat protein
MTTNMELHRYAVDTLHHLIKLLFAEPSPDILTLGDFEYRYQFSRLGEPATQAIEKSQRINRRRGNYHQIGLCEFHIGLIYLSANAYRGAREQFKIARQQWSFVYEPAADALAWFAEGLAHHLAHQFEAAMANYSQASQRLPRIKFAPPSHTQSEFVDGLTAHLQRMQALAHKKLWPEKEAPETAVASRSATPHQDTRPNFEDEREGETAVATAPQDNNGSQTPPPIVNYDTQTTPIPEHQYVGSQYEWYLIDSQPESNFFPADVQKGAWVLVDKNPNLLTGELVLILANEALNGQNGRITVTPVRKKTAYPRIYLGWLENADYSNLLTDDQIVPRPDQLAVTFSPETEQILVKLQEILGVVIGFWLPVQIR